MRGGHTACTVTSKSAKDLNNAKEWYTKGAAQGDKDAQRELDKLNNHEHLKRKVHTEGIK